MKEQLKTFIETETTFKVERLFQPSPSGKPNYWVFKEKTSGEMMKATIWKNGTVFIDCIAQ